MRAKIFVAAMAGAAMLGGCVLLHSGGGETVTSTALNPADAATSLIAGGPLTMTVSTARAAPEDGEDALIKMTLTRGDGRSLSFTEANHAPYDVMAQSAGGPLAQAMGLFGEEAPVLYAADDVPAGTTPFLCAPEGPAYVGVLRGEDGNVMVVGLKSGFEFEPSDSGGYNPLPYSPDHVCARMRFTLQ